MTQNVTVSRHVRCPVDKSSAFVTDPRSLLSQMSTLSRCRFIESCDDGELWDAYLDTGTIYLGGASAHHTARRQPTALETVRGTRHTFEALVEPDGAGSRLTMTMTFSATGYGIARLTELLGRGLAGRNLEAMAEEVRHHLEFER